MSLKYTGNLVNGTEVFAVGAGIITTTYNAMKHDSHAVVKSDGMRNLYIIPAGTPVPANDSTAVGIVFENWDVTDSGGPIPIALRGTINEKYAPVTYTSACKTALRNFTFLNSESPVSTISVTVESSVKASAFDFDSGISLTVTLSGGTYSDSAADRDNWIISLPVGWVVTGIVRTSSTVCTISVNATSSDRVPTGNENFSIGIVADAISSGDSVPAQTGSLWIPESAEDPILLSLEAKTKAADYAYATGLSVEVGLSGDEFVSAAETVGNWNLTAPGGWYLASVTKNSASKCTLVIKNVDSSATPSGSEQISLSASAAALDGDSDSPSVSGNLCKPA